ncbi:MAG: PQQ-binding-like beta-propeller repeat protein [Bacteroidia bacterium]|nr:PQQ-binding-like beta-propeller repeat protein [Bacteroidia bacterium]
MNPFRLLAMACLAAGLLPACEAPESYSREWPVYHGDPQGRQYSPLTQITPENAGQLRVAWTYASGGASPEGRSQIQCNPLVVGGVLYGTSPVLRVFALDAASGRELWTFDPFEGETLSSLGANRGLTYWEDGEDRRIFVTANEWLYALDARSGRPVPGFGQAGRVSLREGLGRDIGQRFIISNTPGALYRNLLILGTRVSENADAAPGHIRAYDVRSGKIVWMFRTIPQPGEPGYETWPPDAWKTAGGANCWAGMSVDPKRGMVYIPTGSASYDFYGGNRLGDNLFANCILALDAATGAYRWHFQTVHHDLWDRDLPAPPDLLTITYEGRKREVVAQATKSGFVFVLDRDTGKPVFPVEEQPVPPSELAGEQAAPAQPVPLAPPPFARQVFTEAEATDLSPASREAVLARLRQVRTGQRYIPPSREGSMIFPGFDGGAEWGGAAVDPVRGMLYVNANEMPWILTMIDAAPAAGTAASSGRQVYVSQCAACHGAERQGDPAGVYPSLLTVSQRYKPDSLMRLLANGRRLMPSFGHLNEAQREAVAQYLLDPGKADHEAVAAVADAPAVPYTSTGYNRFLDPEGYPAVRPPWGTLSAIDLNRGVIAWQVPLGEMEALTQRGIPKTGTENYGGPVVTAGGLIFIAASKDEHIRAFHQQTGEEVWKYKLPAGGYATPAVYEAGGRQYVVIACGGGKMGTPSGDQYIAFSLE